MTQKRGLFLTVEGVEGVGKSSNIEFIAGFLAKRGIACLQTREPGGTPLAEGIRSLLLDHRDERVEELSELLLMFAARVQHVKQVIEPALARGTWVICDRFTDSTYAYQGAGRGVSADTISELERILLGAFRPDLTILLDLPVEVGLQRAEKRGAQDRFEQEETPFFQRVREEFLARAVRFPERFRVVSTRVGLEAVRVSISNILEDTITSY
jgi:dTMP kinase